MNTLRIGGIYRVCGSRWWDDEYTVARLWHPDVFIFAKYHIDPREEIEFIKFRMIDSTTIIDTGEHMHLSWFLHIQSLMRIPI